jgi:hypothetical protein
MKIMPHAALPRPVCKIEMPKTRMSKSSSSDCKSHPRKPNNSMKVEEERCRNDGDDVSEEPLNRVSILCRKTDSDDETMMNLVDFFVSEGDFVESTMSPIEEAISANVTNENLEKESSDTGDVFVVEQIWIFALDDFEPFVKDPDRGDHVVE